MYLILSIIFWSILFLLNRNCEVCNVPSYHRGGSSGSGKKGGGGEVSVLYHYCYAISEIQVWEKSMIVWEHRLGNVVLIGDGATNSVSIANAWLKKFFFAQGSGYAKLFPEEIKLYKNSLNTQLVENSDFTYDKSTGIISFLFVPQSTDLICGTWTYDTSHPDETTVYADFSIKELIKKIGLKPYKYVDEGLASYIDVCNKGKDLMDELYKNIFPGGMTIAWNPKIAIGQSILVKDDKLGLQKVYFIEGYSESHSLKDHSISIQAISFPEDEYFIAENVLYKYSYKFELFLPQFMINFIEYDRDPQTSPDYIYHDDMVYFTSKVYNTAQELDTSYDGTTKIRLVLPYKAPNKTRLFHNTEWINTTPLRPKLGVIGQAFDISFHKHANGEYIDDASFDTAFPEIASSSDVFFEKKLCTFKIYDTSVPEFSHTVQQHVLVGRKPIHYSDNTDQGYPMPRRMTTFGRTNHIIFIDKDNFMWMCDYRFKTKKLGSAYDAIHSKIPEILTTDGRIIGMFRVSGGTWNLKYWNLDTSAWVEIGNVTLQTIVEADGTERHYKPLTPIVDANGNNIIMITGDGAGVGTKNEILLLKGNTISVSQIPALISAISVSPIIFNNLLWFDYRGRNKTTYVVEETINLTYPGNARFYYFTDTTKTTLWAMYDIMGSADFKTSGDIHATENWFTLIKRNGVNDWIKIGTWYHTFGTTLWHYPLFAVGNKVAVLLRGTAVNEWYGISTLLTERKALGIIDTSTGELNLISIREVEEYSVGGLDLYGTEKFTIWFNNMCLWQWCDYSNIIRTFDRYQVQIKAGTTM